MKLDKEHQDIVDKLVNDLKLKPNFIDYNDKTERSYYSNQSETYFLIVEKIYKKTLFKKKLFSVLLYTAEHRDPFRTTSIDLMEQSYSVLQDGIIKVEEAAKSFELKEFKRKDQVNVANEKLEYIKNIFNTDVKVFERSNGSVEIRTTYKGFKLNFELIEDEPSVYLSFISDQLSMDGQYINAKQTKKVIDSIAEI